MPEGLLKALELTIARRVDGLLAGDHRSSLLGRGTELAQVRPYVPGDDVRLIDWNVTARTTEPHVRVHLAERVLVTWIVLDLSPSMAFGTATRRKADVALGVTLAIGHAATVRGNRVGLVGFGGATERVLPPTQGRAGLVGLLLALRDGYEPDGITGMPLSDALTRVAGAARQRALVVVVSDFRGPRDWRRPLLRLAGRHQVVAIEVRDPREQALEPAGTLWLVDPRAGTSSRSTPTTGSSVSASRKRPLPSGERSRGSSRARVSPTWRSRPTATGSASSPCSCGGSADDVRMAARTRRAGGDPAAGRRLRARGAEATPRRRAVRQPGARPESRRRVAWLAAVRASGARAGIAGVVDRGHRATARRAGRRARRSDDRADHRRLTLDGGEGRATDPLPGRKGSCPRVPRRGSR